MNSTSAEEYATYYLERVAHDESAAFALIEGPEAIAPLLVLAFKSEPDAAKRAAILRIIWERRDPRSIPVLGEGLRDASPGVWKEALDGLVTIGSRESISEIEAAKQRIFASDRERDEFREFLDEALEQLRSGLFDGTGS
jgi:HEAT repeat protein